MSIADVAANRPVLVVDSRIDEAYQADEAIRLLREALDQCRPYAVAIVDLPDPSQQGSFETVERLRQADPDLQLIFCADQDNCPAAEIVARLGCCDNVLVLKKPPDPAEALLAANVLEAKWRAARQGREKLLGLEQWVVDTERVIGTLQKSHDEFESAHREVLTRTAELTRLVQQHTLEAVATRDAAVFALAQLAESRDPQTVGHLERMRAYAQVLAERLAGDGPYAEQIDQRFLEDLYRGSPLHDIGKVGIPDRVLLKPSPLTPEEFEIIKTHTVIGATALRQAAEQSAFRGFLDMATEIALRHHERFDGAGYPGGLRGLEIPLAARIVAVADEFDALSSARVYKDAMSLEAVRRSIEEEEGRHFDPVVVDAFRHCCEEFARILAGHRPT